MKIYSYVITWDKGFAPNPFGEHCTLATCKPKIRKSAQVGDWVLGTAGSRFGAKHRHLVFAMQVEETLTFQEYWDDPRFAYKKPVNVEKEQDEGCLGDNCYHKVNGKWVAEKSQHCPTKDDENDAVEEDVGVNEERNRLLIASKFVYFGDQAIAIPAQFRRPGYDSNGRPQNIVAGRGHKCNFSPWFVRDFLAWLEGVVDGRWQRWGEPLDMFVDLREKHRC